ncbi:MAG: hypothetical protein OEW45_01090 [Deltaproteobacteria bacterium]|jgi:hypothetical protein|nr:hypothetical protein [Deltaproteobacteria bacterium]
MRGLKQVVDSAQRIFKNWSWFFSLLLLFSSGCFQRSDAEGSPAIKIFLALGICLAAIFIVFFIVVKGREKD